MYDKKFNGRVGKQESRCFDWTQIVCKYIPRGKCMYKRVGVADRLPVVLELRNEHLKFELKINKCN